MVKPTFLNLPPQKRQQIEEAAIEEFAERPYAKASVSRMVERLGIAKGSIYQYFENKLDLHRWLLEQAARKKLEYFGADPRPAPGEFFVWLERAFAAGLRFAVAHPRIARIALAWWHSHDPDLSRTSRHARQVALEHAARLVREAQAHGEIRSDVDPYTLAVLLQSVQASMLEVIRVRLKLNSEAELFESEGLAALSDADIDAIVHQLINFFRSGAAATEATVNVEPGPLGPPPDVEDTLRRIFRPSEEKP